MCVLFKWLVEASRWHVIMSHSITCIGLEHASHGIFELAHMYFMSFLCVYTRKVLCRYHTKGNITVLYTNSQYTYVIISLQFLTHQIQEWNQTVRTSIKNPSHIVTQSTSIITQCEYDKALSISTKPCTKGKYWMITMYNITVWQGQQNQSGCSGFGRTSFSQGKGKIPFLQRVSDNHSASVILGLIRLIILSYNR